MFQTGIHTPIIRKQIKCIWDKVKHSMNYQTLCYADVVDFSQPEIVAENTREPFYCDASSGIKLYNDDTLLFFENIPNHCIDLIFADPPYFLSSGGLTCHNGKVADVDKGDWDKARPIHEIHSFNKKWISECQRILKKDATIWVCGTFHNFFSVGFALQELGFKILNNVVWEKKDPPPNLTKKYFVHASEHLVWASKNKYAKHLYNYEALREISNGQSMKSVWRDIWTFPAADPSEKTFGKHPTQKPEEIIRRAIIASSVHGDIVFDPFCGSGTTGVVCKKLGRKFIGIDNNAEYLDTAKKRISAMERDGSSTF